MMRVESFHIAQVILNIARRNKFLTYFDGFMLIIYYAKLYGYACIDGYMQETCAPLLHSAPCALWRDREIKVILAFEAIDNLLREIAACAFGIYRDSAQRLK